MDIFIELGNTRLKLATSQTEDYQYMGAYEHTADIEQTLVDVLEVDLEDVENVYVCSVAGSVSNAKITQVIQSIFQIYPTFLSTQPESCGITCGYDKFDELGVDRWMAIIGACGHSSQPTIIVDAGTALTVDMVIDKKHHGGFIVPGLGLMRRSLFAGTEIADKPIETQVDTEMSLLATNTSTAIAGGSLLMVSAFINTLVHNLEMEMGRRFKCIGTGGDFEVIMPMLEKQFDYIHDLTLIGMIEMIKSC